jgi:hypothetical protein
MRKHVPVLALAAVLGVASLSGAADPRGTGILEGEVLRVEPDSIIMKKDSDGHEVRLRMADFTQRGGEFKGGDKIEAFVTPDADDVELGRRRGMLRSPSRRNTSGAAAARSVLRRNCCTSSSLSSFSVS